MVLEAYQFSNEEAQVIQSAIAENICHSASWGADAVTRLKKPIRDHYLEQQKYKCCYCQRENLTDNGRDWDIEHIVSRNERSNFTFVSENMALSCHDCNGHKLNKPVLANKNAVHYPATSNGFVIFHPHFDEYSDHIIEFFGYVYAPLTDKGAKTITHCKLTRFAERLLNKQERDELFKALQSQLMILIESESEIEKRACLSAIAHLSGVKL